MPEIAEYSTAGCRCLIRHAGRATAARHILVTKTKTKVIGLRFTKNVN